MRRSVPAILLYSIADFPMLAGVPQVFANFTAFLPKHDDLSGMPNPAFFYGLQIGEETEIEIDPGKILIIKPMSIGEVLVKKGEQVDSDDLLVKISTV